MDTLVTWGTPFTSPSLGRTFELDLVLSKPEPPKPTNEERDEIISLLKHAHAARGARFNTSMIMWLFRQSPKEVIKYLLANEEHEPVRGKGRAALASLVAVTGVVTALDTGSVAAAPKPKQTQTEPGLPFKYVRIHETANMDYYAIGDRHEVEKARAGGYVVLGGRLIPGGDLRANYVPKPKPVTDPTKLAELAPLLTPTPHLTPVSAPIVSAPIVGPPAPTTPITVPPPVITVPSPVTTTTVAPAPPVTAPVPTTTVPQSTALNDLYDPAPLPAPVSDPFTAQAEASGASPTDVPVTTPTTPAPLPIVAPATTTVAAPVITTPPITTPPTHSKSAARTARRNANITSRQARKSVARAKSLEVQHVAAVEAADAAQSHAQILAAQKDAAAQRAQAAQARASQARAEQRSLRKDLAKAPTVTAPVSQLPPNANVVYNYLTNDGLTPIATTGIIGNMEAESNIEPERLQGTGPGTAIPAEDLDSYELDQLGWGLVQATPASKMVDAIDASGGDPNSIYAQLSWLWGQIQGTDIETALNDAPTAGAAAAIFESTFELPAPATAHLRERIGAAQNAYNAETATTIPQPEVNDPSALP